MKRFIQTGIVLSIAVGLWQVSADARFLDLKQKPQTSVPSLESQTLPQFVPPSPLYESKVNSEGVSLHFESLTVLDALRNIQDETGILFSIAPSIEALSLNSEIQAVNWKDAVKQLLKGFSRVEVWTNHLETSRIWVLAEAENIKAEPEIHLNQEATLRAKPSKPNLPRIKIASSQNNKKKSSVGIEDLPPHILFEPGVLIFLKSKGIEFPEDIKSMFGPNLEGLPTNIPISTYILNDPIFIEFLNSNSISSPAS